MSTRIEDEARWFEEWRETPLGVAPARQARACRPEDLLDAPGVCVKTHALGERGLPLEYGVLVRHSRDADEVVVRGHGSPVSGKFVWVGTVREYETTWKVD